MRTENTWETFRVKRKPQRRRLSNFGSFSTRSMAFALFDTGESADSAAFLMETRPDTIKRYYRDWRKLPYGYKQQYLLVRQTMRYMSPQEKDLVYKALAHELGCAVGEIEEHMGQPWALRDLVTQRWRQWKVNKKEDKGTASQVKRVIDSIIHHSKEVEYVIKAALGTLPTGNEK